MRRMAFQTIRGLPSEDAESPRTQRKAKSHASRTAAPRSRDGSKQAQLIAMLRRANAASASGIAARP